MKIFVIKTHYEFNLKLKELYDKGYYIGSKEIECKEMISNLPQWHKEDFNPVKLKSLIIYLGLHEDEPMQLEWDSIFIKPDETGTSLKEIKKDYPEAEIQFIGKF